MSEEVESIQIGRLLYYQKKGTIIQGADSKEVSVNKPSSSVNEVMDLILVCYQENEIVGTELLGCIIFKAGETCKQLKATLPKKVDDQKLGFKIRERILVKSYHWNSETCERGNLVGECYSNEFIVYANVPKEERHLRTERNGTRKVPQ